MRVAILGGTFDPIHQGHMQIAKEALKQIAVDEVWFMPAKAPPLKTTKITSLLERAHMIQTAIQPYRRFRVSLLEGELFGQSYTIQTVKELKKRYPTISFCWLIGDDQAQNFRRWKDSEQLRKSIDFYVFSRYSENVLPHGFKRVIMPLVNVSSTEIRMGLKWHFLSKGVRSYIGSQGLYLSTILQARMCEKRYLHSCSVADVCVQLGKVHGLHEKTCYMMGLLHDIAKEMPYEKAYIWMKYHMPEHLHEKPAIWHGYIGAYVVKHALSITNKHIQHAIFTHVLGNVKNDYDRVLFIADKLDPLRGYDQRDLWALCTQDLKQGFHAVKASQVQYLKQSGVL